MREVRGVTNRLPVLPPILPQQQPVRFPVIHIAIDIGIEIVEAVIGVVAAVARLMGLVPHDIIGVNMGMLLQY